MALVGKAARVRNLADRGVRRCQQTTGGLEPTLADVLVWRLIKRRPEEPAEVGNAETYDPGKSWKLEAIADVLVDVLAKADDDCVLEGGRTSSDVGVASEKLDEQPVANGACRDVGTGAGGVA